METILITGIVFSGIILALIIIAGTVLLVVRMRQSGTLSGKSGNREDEAAMIQEIYTGLSRMEQRVEALETILMDHKKKDDSI